MKEKTPRLRIFAGPNGSGKSTITSVISQELLGIYINPDDMEREIRENGNLDIKKYQIEINQQEILSFFQNSSLLKSAHLLDEANCLGFEGNYLLFRHTKNPDYLAAVTADFIRQQLIKSRTFFSFETVMSHPDKIQLLSHARAIGYRTYLYYVATEDPQINISRVKQRVKMGGHPVPEDKIINRYYRSLDLLHSAVQNTNRSYIFDNSNEEHIWIAEITNGQILEMKVDQMPQWFKAALWDKFNIKADLSV
jgi:predicted ABC-type ATPase